MDEGIEGLVHISELAERHVEIPEQVVQVGDDIFVKVIDIDLERRRISLSLKQANEGLTGDSSVDQFDPTLYGMAANHYDEAEGTTPGLRGNFDSETGDWLPGFDSQREEWERQYAEARARFEAHRKQIEESRAKAEEAAENGEVAEGGVTTVESAPRAPRAGRPASEPGAPTGTLASDEALAALREKLSGGQS